jgi:hypothetical protein
MAILCFLNIKDSTGKVVFNRSMRFLAQPKVGDLIDMKCFGNLPFEIKKFFCKVVNTIHIIEEIADVDDDCDCLGLKIFAEICERDYE